MSVGSILNTTGRTIGTLAYQKTPVFLMGGIAEKIPGGIMPIFMLTEAVNQVNSLLSGAFNGGIKIPSLDTLWCDWQPISGSTLINNEIGMYPFANQTVAANAVIANPLNISMKMIAPARGPGSFVTKLGVMQSLQAALEKHIFMGGLFTVITPAHIYDNVILTRVVDATPAQERNPASIFEFDFQRPLTTMSQAAQQQGTLMKKLSGGMTGIGGWNQGSALNGPLGWIGFI